MGSPDFALPPLRALHDKHDVRLVVSKPDKPKGRGKSIAMPVVKEAALEMGLNVSQPQSVKTEDFLNEIKATEADIGIVVAYGKILPRSVLEAFPLGCLNIHGSLLPRHRGAAPIQWSVLLGDDTTGVSIMQLDVGMDTGPVFLKKEIPIGVATTAGQLFDELAPLGASALIEALEGIEDGSLKATPQDENLATHARMLKKSDGEFSFELPGKDVSQKIRGLDPWPGAYLKTEKGALKVFGGVLSEKEGASGTLLEFVDDGIVVACQSKSVFIKELQAPGKKRLPAKVYAQGQRLKCGDALK